MCVFGLFVCSERRKSERSQDCPPNFSPLRQIVREHAVHPSCWICVLSRPFPSVQTMSEVNPSTAVERTRCSNCVCQVRLQVLALDLFIFLIHVEEYHLFNLCFLVPGWYHQSRPSWLLQLATSLLLPARTSSRTSKSKNAHYNMAVTFDLAIQIVFHGCIFTHQPTNVNQ